MLKNIVICISVSLFTDAERSRGKRRLASKLWIGSWPPWTSFWWRRMIGCRSRCLNWCMRMATSANIPRTWELLICFLVSSHIVTDDFFPFSFSFFLKVLILLNKVDFMIGVDIWKTLNLIQMIMQNFKLIISFICEPKKCKSKVLIFIFPCFPVVSWLPNSDPPFFFFHNAVVVVFCFYFWIIWVFWCGCFLGILADNACHKRHKLWVGGDERSTPLDPSASAQGC